MVWKRKHIDDIIWEIFEKDQKNLGLTKGNIFTRIFTGSTLYLTHSEQKKVTARSGYSIGQLVHLAFANEQIGLTFDDITGSSYRSLDHRQDADISTKLTNKINLPTPIISSNMEDVTGYEMAVAMAQMGGLGPIHHFDKPEDQAKIVEKVKKTSLEIKEIDGRKYTPALAQDKTYLVGASIGVREGSVERAKILISAGANILIVDIAHGHSDQLISIVSRLKDKYPEIPIIAGNVVAPKGVYDLYKAGADVVKVGGGPGAACTSRLIAGYGIPQLTAIYISSLIAKKYGIKVIADGGIKGSGDIVKSLAAGAGAVMLGRLLAATDKSNNFESRIIEKDKDEKPLVVRYSGSASEYSKNKQGRGDFDAPEGRTIYIPYSGDTYKILAQLMTGIQSGFSYAGRSRDPTSEDGHPDIPRLQIKSKWMRQTPAGIYEGNKGMTH